MAMIRQSVLVVDFGYIYYLFVATMIMANKDYQNKNRENVRNGSHTCNVL